MVRKYLKMRFARVHLKNIKTKLIIKHISLTRILPAALNPNHRGSHTQQTPSTPEVMVFEFWLGCSSQRLITTYPCLASGSLQLTRISHPYEQGLKATLSIYFQWRVQPCVVRGTGIYGFCCCWCVNRARWEHI